METKAAVAITEWERLLRTLEHFEQSPFSVKTLVDTVKMLIAIVKTVLGGVKMPFGAIRMLFGDVKTLFGAASMPDCK